MRRVIRIAARSGSESNDEKSGAPAWHNRFRRQFCHDGIGTELCIFDGELSEIVAVGSLKMM